MTARGTIGLVINSPGLAAGASDMVTSWTSQIGLAIGYRDDISSVWLNTPAGRSQPVSFDQSISPSLAMALGDMLFPFQGSHAVVLYTGTIDSRRTPRILDPDVPEDYVRFCDVIRFYRTFVRITGVCLDFAGGSTTGPKAVSEYGLGDDALGVNRLARALKWGDHFWNLFHVPTRVEAVPVDDTGQAIDFEGPIPRSVCLSRFIRNNEAKLRRMTSNPDAQWPATNRLTIWHRKSDENSDAEIRSWRDRGYNMIVPANQQPEIERVLRIYREA